MSEHYILDENGEPTPCGLLEWARWLETADDKRCVAEDMIGEWRVSTVFLGLDHSFGGATPILFETMIFGPEPHDGYQERYPTKAAALAGHAVAVALVRGSP